VNLLASGATNNWNSGAGRGKNKRFFFFLGKEGRWRGGGIENKTRDPRETPGQGPLQNFGKNGKLARDRGRCGRSCYSRKEEQIRTDFAVGVFENFQAKLSPRLLLGRDPWELGRRRAGEAADKVAMIVIGRRNMQE